MLLVTLPLFSRVCRFRFGVCPQGESPPLLACAKFVRQPSLVPGIFVCPATFAIGLFALVRPSGIFSTGFGASAGLRDAFSTGFVAPVGLLSAFSVLSLRGAAPTTGCGVYPVFALVRAPMEDNRRSADVVPSSLGVCRCFVDEVSAV